ncbi:MAG: LPXTG cell wall anchor domain-containing protein [Anaerolineales bacterium]|jgi:LPXTG-motif cell wall-anchored protein
MLDDFDLDFPEDEEEEVGEERPNRTFLMVAGGLGAVIVISLICVGAYILLGGQGEEDAQAQSATQTAIAAAAATSQSASQTALAQIPTNTSPPTPTDTQIPSTATSTEPFIPTATGGIGPTSDPRTATVQSLLTQAAQAQTQAAAELLTVSPTSTALPDTGFVDDIGAPALLGLAVLLILVIFVARRLRVEAA